MKNILILALLCCYGILSAQGYRIGDIYTAPDGSQGIVYWLHPDNSGGWVVALEDSSPGCEWGNSNHVTGLNSQSPTYSQYLLNDTAGYNNTQIIRSYQNNNNSYAAGLVDFAHGWVLPSPAQLSVLFAQLPFITNALSFAGGVYPTNTFYWTSAERDASSAWLVSLNGGYFSYYPKSSLYPVRAVRSFSYETESDYSYQWSTGDNTSDITVAPTQTTTYTVTVSTSGGSADTVEQTIVVKSVEPQTFYDEVCQGESYIGNGFSISENETSTPGMVVRTRTEDVNGCPSTYTLELTVNAVPHTEMAASACDSYEWNGQTYTQSGDYTALFPYPGGCDSVATLHLTITGQPEAAIITDSDTLCVGDAVILQTEVTAPPSGPVLHVPPVAIGDILCTDNSIVKPSAWPVAGKTAMGIVFYVDNTGEHGWALRLNNENSDNTMKWGGSGVDVPELNNISLARNALMDLDGYTNTQKIQAAGTAATYPAAYSVDFANGWYLPASGQLRCIYSQLPVLNASLQITGGLQFSMNAIWGYWSSTESNANNAWHLDENGQITSYTKNMTYRVRAVRNF